MLIALPIILLSSLGALLLAAGFIGRTVQTRRTFCRSCSYEIAPRMTTCAECGSCVTSSSLDIAFALNHPRLAALTAKLSSGKRRATRSLVTSGLMCLALAAALIAATLYTGAHTRTWQSFAPSSLLIKSLEHANSLAAAKPTITELRTRIADGSLSTRLHARMEQLVNDLTPAPSPPVLAAVPIRESLKITIPRNNLPLRASTRPNRPQQQHTNPPVAPPKSIPEFHIVESWPIHNQPRTAATGDEFSIATSSNPKLAHATPEPIERMQANLRAQGLPSPSVLLEHDFEIRVPSFQPVGVSASLYPGLAPPRSIAQRSYAPAASQRTTTPFSHAPRRIRLNKIR